MTNHLSKVGLWSRAISNQLEKILKRACIAVAAVMVLDVLIGIVARYIFSSPFSWAEELGRYTMIYSAFLGLGVALKRGQHVGLTFVIERLKPNVAIPIDIFGRIAIGIFLFVMTLKGIDVCKLVSFQISPGLGISMVWVLAIVPLSSAVQLVFLILMTLEDLWLGFSGRHLAIRHLEINNSKKI
jgi:TRAP-type C4-dicarboxylate transport system permease small subunit